MKCELIHFTLQIIGAWKLFHTNLIVFMQAMCDVCAMSYWSFRMVYLSFHWEKIVQGFKNFQDIWNGLHNINLPEWQKIVKSSKKLANQMSIFVLLLFVIANTSYEVVALWLSLKSRFDEVPGDMFYGLHVEYVHYLLKCF